MKDAASINPVYIVEYSDDPDIGDEVPRKGFVKYEAALTFANHQVSQFRCVWIREMGKYKSFKGGEKQDWLYFWTTPDTDYGTQQVRGWGIPRKGDSVDLHDIKSYTPLGDLPIK